MNRSQFARYLSAIQNGSQRGVYEEKTATEKEVRRLKKELKRVTEERDILKKPRCTSPTSPTEVHLYSGAQQQHAGVES